MKLETHEFVSYEGDNRCKECGNPLDWHAGFIVWEAKCIMSKLEWQQGFWWTKLEQLVVRIELLIEGQAREREKK